MSGVKPCLALVLAAAVLGGCSLFHPRPPTPAPVVVAPPPPPPPALPLPMDTHKFVLGSADDDLVGVVQTTVASKEDTLPDIARRFNVGYDEIVRANPGVDPWVPGAGRHIVVPTQFVLPDAPRAGIVINIAAMRLFYFPPHKSGEPALVYTHPIGIGKVGWSTPQGVTTVVSHVKDPVWRPSAALRRDHLNDTGEAVPAVVQAGPDNPLGKYEFTLGWPSYRIHGTNKPYGIGMRSSHGCIRLYPEDIEQLFKMVPNKTQVRVVNQPYLFGWHTNELYLQAYTVLEDDARDWSHAEKKLLSQSLAARIRKTLHDQGQQLNWQSIADVTHAPRGVPVPVTGATGGLNAVLDSAPVVQNRVPIGANWNGEDETNTGGKSAEQILTEREPAPTPASTPAPTPTTTSAAPAAAPAMPPTRS